MVGDIDIRRIRYFLALGAIPHFGRAAARLHISQPTLSRQIRLLEKELEVALLVEFHLHGFECFGFERHG